MVREYVLQDFVSGTANVTKNWTVSMDHITIYNDDATADVSVAVNGMTIVVKPYTTVQEVMEPFRTMVVTATAAFRIAVRDMREYN